MSQSEFNVWSKWDPLKKIVIGTCIDLNYFEHVKNIEIREKLTKILTETQEDLDNFAKVMQSLGVEVIRGNPSQSVFPKRLDPYKKAEDTIKVLLYPRDYYAVIGNNFLASHRKMVLRDYYPEFTTDVRLQTDSFWHDLLVKKKMNYVAPPYWTLVGKDLFIDTHDITNGRMDVVPPHFKQRIINDISKSVSDWMPQIDLHWLDIGGHNDSCYHTCKPGAILSLYDIQKYSETFPGWEVLYLPDQSHNAIKGFKKIRSKTKGKYWIPGEEDNDVLLEFINAWLGEWLGYVAETVFDVNIVMVNENIACVGNYNKEVFEFFKKHKIEPIIVPLRHRYFWDGGLHCSCLDLYRQGECQSYINYK